MSTPEALTALEHRIIRFEVAYPSDTAEKRRLIASSLQMTPAQYERRLVATLALPAAHAEYPIETRRIQHRREVADARGFFAVIPHPRRTSH